MNWRHARDVCPDARLRLLASRIHALGDRALYELLRELVTPENLLRLERYAEIDSDVLAAHGGSRLPAPSWFFVEAREC